MRKRVLALLLLLSLSGALLPVTAAAREAEARVPSAPTPPAPEREEPAWIIEETEPGPARPLSDAPDYAGAIEALRQGVINREEKIDLKAYGLPCATQEDLDALTAMIAYIHNRYGELFVLGRGGFSGRNMVITCYTPTYTMTAEEYAQAKAFYNEALDAIVAQVPAGLGRMEQVLFIHDYLAAHYAYDQRATISGAPCNRDAYSFLQEGVGVCQAYALVFSALMDRLSIPVTYVESESLNHIWNAVELEGKWYHVDVTWDDPLINDTDVSGAARHTYFLLGDTANRTLRQEEQGDQYQNDEVYGDAITCDASSYEIGACARADSPMVYVPGNDTWYYLSTDQADKGLYRVDKATGQGEKIEEVAYSQGFYDGIAPLTEYQGSLFFSDPARLYRYELATGEAATLLTAQGEQRLSGLGMENGVLSYKQLARTEREDGTVETVETVERFSGALMPCHEAMGGAFSYYYNFGGVGLTRPADSPGQLLLAWYDPLSGRMKRLAAAEADGVYGEAVTDKDLRCVAFLLEDDGALTPIYPKFLFPEGN